MSEKLLVCLVCCFLLAALPVAAAPNEGSPIVKDDPASLTAPAIRFALTFDGGPSREYTPRLLAVMSRYGARGTFFSAGKNSALYPELIRQITAGGSEIGGYSASPSSLTGGPYTTYYETAPMATLGEITGAPAHYSGPGYREEGVVFLKQAPEIGLTTVIWVVDPRDLSDLSPAAIAEKVLASLRPGSIVVLHDGDGARQATVDAVEIILREASARGYNSVPLSELEGFSPRDYYSTRSRTWLNNDQAEVRNIQARLEELGYDCGGVDGVIGPNTEQGIRRFIQGARGDAGPRPAERIARSEIRINIPDYSLSLIENGKLVKRYDIAVGTPYEQTPTGNFAIFAKIEIQHGIRAPILPTGRRCPPVSTTRWGRGGWSLRRPTAFTARTRTGTSATPSLAAVSGCMTARPGSCTKS